MFSLGYVFLSVTTVTVSQACVGKAFRSLRADAGLSQPSHRASN